MRGKGAGRVRGAFYARYTTRSLARGGQRTLLAVLCIAVGVMAIVALGLASEMVSASLTRNVRAANGGDIAVRSDLLPLHGGDLGFFLGLRLHGEIAAYTAVSEEQATASHGGRTSPVRPDAVDPDVYPLAGQPAFTAPRGGAL